VVRRRFEYDEDPAGFAARYAVGEQELASTIRAARQLLPAVQITDAVLDRITAVCAAFEVDGMRADIVMTRAAAARAALHERLEIQTEDIRAAAELVLPHRRRRNPLDAPGLDPHQLDEVLDDDLDPDPPPNGPGREPDAGPAPETDTSQDQPLDPPADAGGDAGDNSNDDARPGSDAIQPAVEPAPLLRARTLLVPGIGAGAAGRRSKAIARNGKVIRATPPISPVRDLHLVATLTAAALYQHERGRTGPGLLVRRPDLRVAVRIGKEGNLILFMVDASGSMAARHRMAAVKGAVLTLLLDAYQRRDKVGLLSFRGDEVELLLPPTTSVDAAAVRLAELPTGGRTPLAAALVRAGEVLRIERLRDPQRRPLLVVVTDGRHTTGPEPAQAAAALRRTGVASVVINCESSRVRLGLAAVLAGHLGADCLDLGELSAQLITDSVRQLKESA
jgi:magnesium chelatase subunit D